MLIFIKIFTKFFLHQIERIVALFLTCFFRKIFKVLFGNFWFFQLKNFEKSTNVCFRALEGSKSPENGRNEIWPFSNFPGENMGFSDFWPLKSIFSHLFRNFYKGGQFLGWSWKWPYSNFDHFRIVKIPAFHSIYFQVIYVKITA